VSSVARFAWAVLAYNLGVIAWGAYVRATRSGAGCGAHWPLCNGEVIPRAPDVEMLVEFSHRATSGLALVAVVALALWVRRACAPGHPARRGAAWSLLFMLTEAALGAGLVLFQLVADNESMARALFMSAHLANTFVLVACLALTAHWLSGGAPLRLRARGALLGWALAGAAGLILAGISGAIAALGDTLYPGRSIAAGLGDLSPTGQLLIRLRLLHPAITIAVGVALMVSVIRLGVRSSVATRKLAVAVGILTVIQLGAGFLNVLLLAPVWMQMVHLLLADLLWISFVLFAATLLGGERTTAAARAAA
jgi:heme A synthase